MSSTNAKKTAQAGFTLIEVIAVLVILAVLAAVAIPRYMSLIDDAREQALEGAVAAGLSHTSMAYGRYCLTNGVAPTASELATECGTGPNSTDYTFSFAGSGTDVAVTATEVDDASFTLTKNWSMP